VCYFVVTLAVTLWSTEEFAGIVTFNALRTETEKNVTKTLQIPVNQIKCGLRGLAIRKPINTSHDSHYSFDIYT
jgi:hypothetical protein